MAKCDFCEQEMLDPKVKSCLKVPIEFPDGKKVMPDTSYYDEGERCHDCGIENKPGNVHHPGCDIERCPRCGDQLISCGCIVEIKMEELESKSMEELKQIIEEG